MNIDNLRRLVEIYKTGSITQAAVNLYLSQPYLSNILKEAEREVGFKIFIRGNDGVTPTVKGEGFLKQAKEVLHEYSQFENFYLSTTNQIENISIVSRRSSYISIAVAQFTAELSRLRKCLTVRYTECTNQEAIDNVFKGNADFGIIRFEEAYYERYINRLKASKMAFKPLNSMEIVVLMSVNHPLASYDRIEIGDLANYFEVIHGDFETIILSDIRENNLPKNKIYVYERGSLLDLISRFEKSYAWTTATHPDILDMYEMTERKVEGCNTRVFDYLIFKGEHNRQTELELFEKIIQDNIVKLKNQVIL